MSRWAQYQCRGELRELRDTDSFRKFVRPSQTSTSIGEALLKSLLRFSYSCELELGTARLLEHKLVARKCHQVNCRRERRLDFDSVPITKLISPNNISDVYGTVA